MQQRSNTALSPLTGPGFKTSVWMSRAVYDVFVHGGSRACYVPRTDNIHMPPHDMFFGTATSTAAEAYWPELTKRPLDTHNETKREHHAAVRDRALHGRTTRSARSAD